MSELGDRPQADPSLITTQVIWREIAALKELFEARLDGMDKAVVILQDIANRSPSVNEVYLQHEEKFNGIQTQFRERDVRVEQTARDTKTAVDAALAAQEKAVGKQNETFAAATSKSESAFTKQIDQQAELLRTEVKGLVTQIDELKNRLNRGEGRGEGVEKKTTDTRLSTGVWIAIGAALISAAMLAIVFSRGG